MHFCQDKHLQMDMFQSAILAWMLNRPVWPNIWLAVAGHMITDVLTDWGGGVSDGGAEEDRTEEEGTREEDSGPSEADHCCRQQHGEQAVRPQGH